MPKSRGSADVSQGAAAIRRVDWRPWGVAALGLLLVAVCYRDFGVTWDEGVQSRYGEMVRDHFRGQTPVEEIDAFVDLGYYGPLFEASAAFLYAGAPEHRHEIRHLLLGVLSSLTLVLTYLFARSAIRNRNLALLAPVFLASMPRFAAHAFNNSKDLPFALAWLGVMILWGRRLSQPRLPWPQALALGGSLGLLLALRPGGIVPVGAVLGGLWLWFAIRDRRPPLPWLGSTAIVGTVAWLLMIAAWPSAHRAPISHPVEAVQFALTLTKHFDVLYQGASIDVADLPRTYLLHMIGITTPLVLIVLALVGLIPGFRSFGRRPPDAMPALACLWVCVPLALVVLARPHLYDGIRQFLFLLPGIAIVATLGVDALLRRFSSRHRRILVAAILVVLAAETALPLARLHPYQVTYYNATVGGAGGAAGRYEGDYWLSSYTEAIRWIQLLLEAREVGGALVLLGGHNLLYAPETFGTPNLRFVEFAGRGRAEVELPGNVDFYVGGARQQMDRSFQKAVTLHEIRRSGRTLAVIKAHPDWEARLRRRTRR
jgi:hypothetical protein